MTDTPPPTGKRFSHVYMQRGEPAQDSERMRRRLAALVTSAGFADLEGIAHVVPRELGVDVPGQAYGFDWRNFFRDYALQDVLDFITLAYRHLNSKRRHGSPERRWCKEVRRVFQEENVHYTVDDEGGVHFKFDAEFEHNRSETIACLQGPRYRNTLNEFEGAMAALAKAPPDCKSAIRGTFGAAEGLFRLMFPKSPRLTADEAKKLEPILQRLHDPDGVATSAASKLLKSFMDWIDAAQFYRHEAGQEAPTQPPLMLAVQMVSVGASFMRWLGELDGFLQQQGP